MVESNTSGASFFTLNGKPITAIDITDSSKFMWYITDPDYSQMKQQPDPLSTILPLDAIFSDTTFRQIIQRTKETLVMHISQAYVQELDKLKSQLLNLVDTLEQFQQKKSEFYHNLFGIYTTKLDATFKRHLINLTDQRDYLLNSREVPREVDNKLEKYIEDFRSFRNLDFKQQTQELLDNLRIPFVSILPNIDNIRSILGNLQKQVKKDD